MLNLRQLWEGPVRFATIRFYKNMRGGSIVRTSPASLTTVTPAKQLQNETPMEDIVSFKHVGKVYSTGTVALKDVHFGIAEGEFISFLGPSGCGKSTAL